MASQHKLKKFFEREHYSIRIQLPQLQIYSEILAGQQKNNGSWKNDSLLTSFAIRALHSVSQSQSGRIFQEEINLGLSYLSNELEKISDDIVKREDLYSGLDDTIRRLGNIAYVILKFQKRKQEERIKPVLEKTLATTSDYCTALGDVDAISSILLPLSLISNLKSSESHVSKLLQFIFNECLSVREKTYEFYSSIFSIISLKDSKWEPTVNSAWNEVVKKRMDEWKDLLFFDGIKRLTLNKIDDLITKDKADLKTLSYALLVLIKIDPADNSGFQAKLVEKILHLSAEERLCKLSVESQSEHKYPKIFELSLIVCALSQTRFANSLFFPLEDRDIIEGALSWYKQREKNILISRNKYYFLIGLVLFLIGLVTYLVYTFYPGWWWVISALGLIIAVYSCLNLLNKP